MPVLADEEQQEIARLQAMTAQARQDVRDMLAKHRAKHFPLQGDILLIEAKIDALVDLLTEQRVITALEWEQRLGTEVASIRHELDELFTAESTPKEPD